MIFIDIKKVIEINIKYLKIFLRVKAQLIFIVLKVTDKIKRKFKASAMHIPIVVPTKLNIWPIYIPVIIIIKFRNLTNTNFLTSPSAVIADSHSLVQTLAIIPKDNIFKGSIAWSQPCPKNKWTISEVFATTNDDMEKQIREIIEIE